MVIVGRLLWYKTNWIDITQYSPACQSVLDRHRQSVAEVQRARHVRWWYTEGEIFIHSVRHLTLGKEWQKKYLCILLFWTQIKTEPSKKPDSRFQIFTKGLDSLSMNLILVSVSAYMLLRAEESLLLPPLIPARLHIFWAVGLREGQSGIWGRMRKTRRTVHYKSDHSLHTHIQLKSNIYISSTTA